MTLPFNGFVNLCHDDTNSYFGVVVRLRCDYGRRDPRCWTVNWLNDVYFNLVFEFLFDGNLEMGGIRQRVLNTGLTDLSMWSLTEKSFSFPIPLNNLGNFAFTLRVLLVSFRTDIALVICIKPSLEAIFPLNRFAPSPVQIYAVPATV
jgi:hypothetical protein